MAITVTVENGSGVAGANSYVTVAEARTFASNRGKSLPASDDAVATLLIRAIDFLEGKRASYQGTKTTPEQVLQFPRSGVVIDGVEFPNNSIPTELKNAQCQLALEAATIELMPTTAGAFVTREKVGPIETEYSERLSMSEPSMPAVDAFLAPLLRVGSFRLQTIRA